MKRRFIIAPPKGAKLEPYVLDVEYFFDPQKEENYLSFNYQGNGQTESFTQKRHSGREYFFVSNSEKERVVFIPEFPGHEEAEAYYAESLEDARTAFVIQHGVPVLTYNGLENIFIRANQIPQEHVEATRSESKITDKYAAELSAYLDGMVGNPSALNEWKKAVE